MKRPTLALAAALIAGLAGILPASAAAPTTELRLSDLDRGAAPAVPYLDDGTLVDGSLRIDLPTDVRAVLGRAGDDYVLLRTSPGTGPDRIVLVSPDGSSRVALRHRELYDAVLAPDGTTIAVANTGTERSTTVSVFDLTTGEQTTTRDLQGYATVLDYDGSRVALGVQQPSMTVLWTLAGDSMSKVSPDAGYRADLANDRLAVFDGDPYRDGCTEVSALTDPGTTIWRSCRERVEAFSTDASRMVTVDLLSDGIGPGRLWVRAARGRILGQYDAPSYFGRVGFEDATHVLLDTYSRTKYAVVRCDSGDCERAGRVHRHSGPVSAPAARPLLARRPAGR